MKKVIVLMLFVLAMTGLMMAQNASSTVDVLGAHNNQGRGCAGCHAPHSGSFGSGHGGISRCWQLCFVGTGCQPTVRQDHRVWRQRQIHGSSAHQHQQRQRGSRRDPALPELP